MGTLIGHTIAGTFLLLVGLWLTVKYTLQHLWKIRRPKAKQLTRRFFKKLEYADGGLLMFAAFVGIMYELSDVDSPPARLFDSKTQSWVNLMVWQHATMYLFFGISGMASVLTVAFKQVPAGIDRVALSLALFIEGFLFYFHVQLRPHLDIHIHSLLLVATFGGSASIMMEAFIRDNFLLQLFGAVMFILQGSWFYQIGFVLYPLNGRDWDLTLHDNIMFVSMCFCWHLAVALLIVASTTVLVWWTATRFSVRDRDTEIGLRVASSGSNFQKALLEESEEE